MNRTVLIIGIVITLAIVVVLFLGLGKDPQHINSPLIGHPAPPFTLKAVGTGEPVDLEKLRGRPVILNFWATWCVPCYEEHPVLVQNARMLGPQVQFVGVVFQDDESKIMQFLRERGSSYPTLMDDKGKTAIAYGVGGVPETFFLDAKGTIVAKFEGPISSGELQANLVKAMGR
ncbi:MAG TPA: redoxin family protein [Thermoanaerobaculia bacterium]|nr:redoxin family protein [Thermoanaerobaculia bacterium]